MPDSESEVPGRPVHNPVMVAEVLAGLNIDPCGTYVDATFGGGGHSRAILQRLGADGRLIALDADARAEQKVSELADRRVSFYHANFRDLDVTLGRDEHKDVKGVLFDLGLSSLQLADAERGFAFSEKGPLDMRLDTSQGQPLLKKLERVSENELGLVLREYGQERRWRKLARIILRRLREGRLGDTAELAAACASGPGWQRIHPATRTFQALRIWVNDELTSLSEGLAKAAQLLCRGGRLVAISFHSLEDRIVKYFMRPQDDGLVVRLGKLQRPSQQEEQLNRRARSARLRVGVRL